MNPSMNMHAMQPQIGAPSVPGPTQMMQPGVSPVMMQASPQQQQQPGPQAQIQPQGPNPAHQQQQAEKIDNISKVKSLLPPLKESLFHTVRAAAFTLQQNNLADNLKRDAGTNPPRFDKSLRDFFANCDLIELHLKTAMQCTQQLSSAQHFLPGAVTAVQMEPPYMQDNPAGPMPYPTYLNTVRVHIQSAKDIHDTLISAAQNISQAD